MNKMKRTMKGLAMLLAICLMAGTIAYYTPAKEAQAASAKITRLDFIKGVMDAMRGQTDAANWDIEFYPDEDGNVTAGGMEKKTIKAKTVASYAKKYKISTGDAQYVAGAIAMGLITKSTFKSVKSKITVASAAIILAKAETKMTAREYSDEDLKLVMKSRISDLKKVKKDSQKKLVAMAYMDGFIKGKSTGAYNDTRKISPTSKLTKSTAKTMFSMISNKNKRYKFSDTWQMLRTSTKKLPKNANLYEYILDSYPNAYYETGWHNMTTSRYWDYRADGKTPYSKSGGTFEERLNYEVAGGAMYFPSELKRFIALPREEKGVSKDYPGYDDAYCNWDTLLKLTNATKEFYEAAMNVDYRTVKKDKEWQKKLLKYMSQEELDTYIESCIKNKTVIECDKVVCDPSLAYWAEAGFYAKVYAHIKVVSDEGIKNKEFDESNSGEHLFPVMKGYETMTIYTRGPLIDSGYKLGDWVDYFAISYNSIGTQYTDGLCCTCTYISPMEDYTGLYPWLIYYPYDQYKK